MTRTLIAAAAASFAVTIVLLAALHASSPVLTVAAVAFTLAVVSRLAGLEMVNSAWTVSLALAGRVQWALTAPLIAAQFVGAALAGALALAADGVLGELQIWSDPSLTSAVVTSALATIVGTWALYAADTDDQPWFTLAGPAVAGAGPSIILVSAAQPAAVVGLLIAGFVPVSIGLAVIATTLVFAVLAGFFARALLPSLE